MRYPFAVMFLAMTILCCGCITRDESDHESTDKTLFLSEGSANLFIHEYEHFQVTSTPAPASSEWLVWLFAGPDTTIHIVQPAKSQNDIDRLNFNAGYWTLRVAIYDSTQYKILGGLASPSCSLKQTITVREVTVDLAAQPAATLQDYIFHANSPEKEWFRRDTDYMWDFGDGTSTTTTNTDITAHHYETGGTYRVIVNISSPISDDDDTKYTVAADTLVIHVDQDIAGLLELKLSSSDTLWCKSETATYHVELNLAQWEYPTEVRWTIEYGDGETLEYIGTLSGRDIMHQYGSTGSYTLRVALYDPVTGNLLAEDCAPVTISNLPSLQLSGTLHAYVSGYVTRHHGSFDADGIWTEKSNWDGYMQFGSSSNDLAWNGCNFSSEHTDVQTKVITLSGSVSDDGTTLIRLEYTNDYIYDDGKGTVWTRHARIVFNDMPLQSASLNRYYFFTDGIDTEKHVTVFEWWNKTEYLDGTTDYDFYDTFDWHNTLLGTPQLIIEFRQL